ncbi:bacteriocin [Nostoc sp. MG11]|uniref:bacteriocin n=1 Tax=Nostoc sp. MG11 TaxID=2721166 RepID=UPI001868920A|nr:bacteriocin [Nostoc sp. MG11]
MSRIQIDDLQQLNSDFIELSNEELEAISGGFRVLASAYYQLAKGVLWAVRNGGQVYGDSVDDPALEAVRGGNMGA